MHVNVSTLCLILVLATTAFADEGGLDCFAVVAGKACSTDGSVLFGHNEDDGGTPRLLHWKVGRKRHPEGAVVRLVRGGTLPEVQETFGYLWSQIPDYHYSDVYLNEFGVALASDACASREDRPELKDGGIGFMIRRLVAQRARTACQGVDIATALLDEFGYAASGRTLIIADAKEAWVLCMVKGKHYAAARVPDDRLMVIANSYPIHEVDPGDRKNFRLSPGLIEYAEKRGWYDADRDGPFDFAFVYARPSTRKHVGNTRRQWGGLRLLAATPLKEGWKLPAFVKPRKKLTPADIMAVLRDHYEGTDLDPTDGYKTGSPHRTGQRTICTHSTRNAVVFQLRSKLPADIGALMWIAMSRPDAGVFMPWYQGIQDVPPGFSGANTARAFTDHFSKEYARADSPEHYRVFADLNASLDRNYGDWIPEVKAMRDDLEQNSFKLQPHVEATALRLFKKDREAAQAFLTAYTTGQTEIAVDRARTLAARLRIRNPDSTAPEKR